MCALWLVRVWAVSNGHYLVGLLCRARTLRIVNNRMLINSAQTEITYAEIIPTIYEHLCRNWRASLVFALTFLVQCHRQWRHCWRRPRTLTMRFYGVGVCVNRCSSIWNGQSSIPDISKPKVFLLNVWRLFKLKHGRSTSCIICTLFRCTIFVYTRNTHSINYH